MQWTENSNRRDDNSNQIGQIRRLCWPRWSLPGSIPTSPDSRIFLRGRQEHSESSHSADWLQFHEHLQIDRMWVRDIVDDLSAQLKLLQHLHFSHRCCQEMPSKKAWRLPFSTRFNLRFRCRIPSWLLSMQNRAILRKVSAMHRSWALYTWLRWMRRRGSSRF